jgi:hypothetical protein
LLDNRQKSPHFRNFHAQTGREKLSCYILRASFRAFFSVGHKRSPVSMTQQGEHNAIANRWFGENDLTLSKLDTPASSAA